jgi:DNA mismatch repair protein MutL
MPIQLLPPEIASQIAAGEVVERPASVVKELVENALDAGAGFISITSEGAGQRLLEVADDGMGIPAEEIPLSLERHATSKLSSAADLLNIRTLGFRGEALASIGSISMLTITSRTKGSGVGARIRVEGGHIVERSGAGAPQGTVVRVENLFYNVPARLKFLKSDSTEKGQIDLLVTRYALAYPQVRFHLRQEGKLSLQTSGNGDRRQTLAALYGVEAARQMLEVSAQYDDMVITGYVSPLTLTRSHRRDIIFYVNGRPVQDSALAAAVIRAYQNLIMVGRYPLGVIFINMPPAMVDVNVHPTKAEVHFRDQSKVFRNVQSAVRRALHAYTPLAQLDPGISWAAATTQSESRPGEEAQDNGWEQVENGQTSGTAPPSADQTQLHSGLFPLLRLIGQVAATYLITEGPDGLYLIDQHAAHERVLYERFMAQLGSPIPSQVLLKPEVVELSLGEARLLEERIQVLERIGFRVEPFGSGTFLVRSIPTLLGKLDPAAALRVVVEDFEEDESPLEAAAESLIIARVCKRAAVKAGQVLSSEEQQALLADLEACSSPRTCPHGRPTMIHLSVDLLERHFGRRGAR